MSRRVNVSHQLFRVLLLAAMVLGLVLPGATGAQGPRDREQVGSVDLLQTQVTPAEVTPMPCDISSPATYTIVFTTNQDMSYVSSQHTDNIRIIFPEDTGHPVAFPAGIWINGEQVTNYTFTAPQTYVLDVPMDIPAGLVTVVFEYDLGGALSNPSVAGDDYTLQVSTSREVTYVTSNPYEICYPSEPVRVMEKILLPTADCGYIRRVFLEGFDTIQEALDYVNGLYLDPNETWDLYTRDDEEINPFTVPTRIGIEIQVMDDDYEEIIVMDTPGVVLKSVFGPAQTTIDGTGLRPDITNTSRDVIGDFGGMAGVVNILASGVTFSGFTVTGGGVNVSGQTGGPDMDENGNVDIQGIFITPWNPKAASDMGVGDGDIIDLDGYDPGVPSAETIYPIYSGRVKVYNNIIHGNQAFGIVAAADIDPGYLDIDVSFDVRDMIPAAPEGVALVVLIEGNEIYENLFGGILAKDLSCGVEVINGKDPTPITKGTNAASEILNNRDIWGNGFAAATVPDGSGGQIPLFDPIVSDDEDTLAMLRSGISLFNTRLPLAGDWAGSTECCMGFCEAGCDTCESGQDCVACCMIFIVDNVINGNANNGISLWEDAAYAPLVIQQNTISENGFAGISTAALDTCNAGDEVAIDCRYNDFSQNTEWGVKNWAGDVGLFEDAPIWFNAKENYWGSMGGPSRGPAPAAHQVDQRSDALGNGDAVSHYVYYNPWLSVSYVDVLADEIRHYGSYIELQRGWNTLSVPVILHSDANSLAEIGALGSWLADAMLAYQYDPAINQYVPVQPNWTLVAGRGYLIRMSKAGKFPVIYSEVDTGLVTFGLAQGWNLVGVAFGIDKVNNTDVPDQGRFAVARAAAVNGDPEARRYAATALDSVRNQASVIISPSMPGQIASWGSTYTQEAQAIGDSNLAANYFYTGEAYWVYMLAPGTLVGLEITPFYFAPPRLPEWFCCVPED